MQSTAAVSITSWLVAPACKCLAASGETAATCAVNSFTNGIARVPLRPSRASCTASNRACSQTREINSACAGGTRPCCADARARAPSNHAIAASSFSSDRSPAQTSSANRSSRLRRASVVEENRLVPALQDDVPLQRLALGLRNECRAARCWHQLQDRILGICRRLVGKVDARGELPEHAAHEYRHDEVRRLQASIGTGDPSGLDRSETKASLGVGGNTAESAPSLFKGFLLRILGMRVLA